MSPAAERSPRFRFSIKDLLIATLLAAAMSGLIELLDHLWPTGDRLFHILAYAPAFASAVGWLLKRFQGAVIGAMAGTFVTVGIWFCAVVVPKL